MHPNWDIPAAALIRNLCAELVCDAGELTRRVGAIHRAHGSLDAWREAGRPVVPHW